MTSSSSTVGGWGQHMGVAGGVTKSSLKKSGIANGGGVSPWSEDWYAMMGAGGACGIASIRTKIWVMTGIGI